MPYSPRMCHPRLVDLIEKIAEGAIAFLWPQGDHRLKFEDDAIVRGFLQRDEEGAVRVRALDESPLESGPILRTSVPPPTCLAAATEYGGALLTGPVGRGRTVSLGGGRASVLRFRTHTILAPIDLAAIKSSRARTVSVYFPEALRWAGKTALTEEIKIDPESKVTSAQYFLGGPSSPLSAGKFGALSLEIEPHWKSSGAGQSSVKIDTSLEVRATSVRARDTADFLPALLGIQDLLSLSHDRFVPATGGKVALEGVDGATPTMWQKDLMAAPTPTRTMSGADPQPLVMMSHLGGAGALGRWLRISKEVPDAVTAITAPYRRGRAMSPALRLQEVAGAIEYYVNMARTARDVAWAKKGNSDSHAHALASRVGAPFASFVGDPKAWAKEFLSAYNGLKHNPTYPRDPRTLRLLAISGDLLLMAAILNRVATSGTPARTIFSDYRIRETGDALRAEVLGI